MPHQYTCAVCGALFSRIHKGYRFCSRACAAIGRTQSDSIENLMEKIDILDGENPCWIWKGALHPTGYGATYSRGKTRLAHRLMYELTHGPVADDLCICHNCPTGDNRLCVNPDHMFVGTRKDNAVDASRKGSFKHRTGQDNPHHKLTTDQVLEIRALVAQDKTIIPALARQLGMSEIYLRRIVNRRFWKHV